jgi:hypothetical protein
VDVDGVEPGAEFCGVFVRRGYPPVENFRVLDAVHDEAKRVLAVEHGQRFRADLAVASG